MGVYSEIHEALSEHGMILRGGFHPRDDDGVPASADGGPASTLLMVGNAGSAMWRAFQRADTMAGDDPLNTWVEEVLSTIAATFDGRALFPFSGPPYLPFQRWAQRADSVWSSPIGILIHPEFGLWHAYRGALVFERQVHLPTKVTRERPCDSCEQRPCLSTCPVHAFSEAGYDVSVCVSHVTRREGRDCIELGCRARRGCPVGREFMYSTPHAAFHQRAFVRARLVKS